MNFYDGQRVTYIGDGENGVSLGDRGSVVSAGEGSSHVMWSTGSRTGEIDLVDHYVLSNTGRAVEARVDDGLDDSLDVGTIAVTALRETFDTSGEAGVLNAMVEGGHLANFTVYAQEVLDLVASRIRTDPSFKAVMASLEDEEGESLVRLASHVLLRDAFGGEDE